MIKGTYVFYEDGKEILRSSNVITRFGKRFLTNFLAGNLVFDRKDLALGIGGSATDVPANGTTYAKPVDTRLDFEFYRLPIQYGSVNINLIEATITNISGNGSVITFTANNSFIEGQKVDITGVSPSSYIQYGATISTASSTQFTISGTNNAAFVSGGTATVTTYETVYKTSIPQDVSGVVKEIALYPGTRTSNNNFDSRFVTTFENQFNWVNPSNGANPSVVSTPTPRIGDYLLAVTNNGLSTSIEYINEIIKTDISGYSVNDNLTLAYNRADTNLTSIVVKLYSSTGNYYSATFTPTSGTGNKIQSVSMSNLFSSTTGSPDPTSISQVGIVVNCSSAGSPATVYFDGLRINDEDSFDPIFGMISRAVLANELVKVAGRQVDIEYRLELGF